MNTDCNPSPKATISMTNYYNAKLFLKNNNTFKEMHPKPIKKENFEGKK